ncbi:MAG: YceI family protein [Alphaproteobacteria bacterium]|nr:YceI family protein [Alphaproteobacteria bacterium]
MRILIPAVAAVFLCATPVMAADNALPLPGAYTLDPSHTSITFKLNHVGFSHFTGRFDKMEGHATFDAAAPEKSTLDVTVNTASIDTNVGELDESLQTENWFDAMKFPAATFHATKIVRTGPRSAKITGDFTLHGITHTLTLDTVLVGAGKMPMIGKQVMGFSASTKFNRSLYGISNGEPMVGDEVTLQIETEFDKDE